MNEATLARVERKTPTVGILFTSCRVLNLNRIVRITIPQFHAVQFVKITMRRFVSSGGGLGVRFFLSFKASDAFDIKV